MHFLNHEVLPILDHIYSPLGEYVGLKWGIFNRCLWGFYHRCLHFDVLRRAGALPATLLDQIEEYFLQLRDEKEDEDSSEFPLGGCGYIIILEAGDNVRDLGNVGLNREDGGLLGSFPEYVETLDIGEGLQAYKIAVLYDNDYLKTFFTQAGAHDEEVEQWLRDQAERN
jgi:hypothetical protein